LHEIASYRLDVNVSIEYKIREPRTHSHIGNMGTALYAIMDAGLPNMGVVIDTGHSLMAYENLAEMATIALRRKALHAFHLNDCYRYADDDLVMGTVHTWEFVELLYWMKQEKFSGWWTLDTYPYREDGIKVIEESLRMFNSLHKIAQILEPEKIAQWHQKNDALAALEYVRSMSLK
ncbi:MAG: TIM barrel protein, partial [Atribacterota bacterium]